MKRILAFVAMIGLGSSLLASDDPAALDIYIKTKHKTSEREFAGQKFPAQEEVFEQWIKDDAIASIMPKSKVIVDTKKNRFLVVDPDKKTYAETSLPLEIKNILPKEIAAMADMIQSTVSVTPTGKTKKIGKWNCKEYDVSIDMMMMQMKQTTWATTDVPFDWKKVAEMDSHLTKFQSQFLGEASIKELLKIEGVPVFSESVVSVMGSEFKTLTEVVEISEKKAPEGMFSVPGDYQKQERLTQEQIQK